MSLNLNADLVTLLRTITDIESVSGNERRLADEIEHSLRLLPHLETIRNGNAVIARTNLGRRQRVLVAGHLDTVPVARNLPSWQETVAGQLRIYGRGTCDMKGGVAVQLAVAAAVTNPRFDLTWVFYDQEEVENTRNGLGRLAREQPNLLAADFAVLGEPTGTAIEGGCQGTMRFRITSHGIAAHSARSWLGHNAIHDMAEVIARIHSFQVGEVYVDGLCYREGLNAVAINGGIAGNVVPDRATIEINYRFAPDKDCSAAVKLMTETFAGYDLEITDLSPAARPGLNLAIAAEFVQAVGGSPRAKYGWTDVARFAELGIPAVNFGPADPSKAHTDDEFCPAADLYYCHDALVTWLTKENDD